jgi:hypothetical protein
LLAIAMRASYPGLLVSLFILLAVFPSAAPGQAGPTARNAALNFDGRDDYLVTEGSQRLGLSRFTVELWLRPEGPGRATVLGPGGVEAVPLVSRGRDGAETVGPRGAGTGLNYLLGIRAGDGVLLADFQGLDGRHHPIAGHTPIASGVWSHAAVTYDGASLRILLNGGLEAEEAVAAEPRFSGRQPLAFGTILDQEGTRAGFFRGALDEIRLWDRVLSPDEIRAAMGREVKAGPGLVARWGLNEGAGRIAADTLGRHPSRVIFGATWVDGTPFSTAIAPEISPAADCVPTPSPLAALVEAGSAMKYRANLSSDEEVAVQFSTGMVYLANGSDPGIGLSWVAPGFVPPATWASRSYGVGYDTGAAPNALALIQTSVPAGTFSVFTRANFDVADRIVVKRLLLGADYDDGFVAWINGVEVFRSPEMPSGAIAWNTNAATHESSNASSPNYSPIHDISAAGLPALVNGTNVLAIGVWNNNAPASTDLVLVPRLSMTEDWTARAFDDVYWADGVYGVGYETAPPGASNLIETSVPPGSFSVFTRARFTIADASTATQLLLGADYDDGFIAWINGTEVFRSPEMPPGEPLFNTNSGLHESSNGTSPNYGTLIDISSVGLPALVDGENVLAVGVWNSGAAISTDLVLVPLLSARLTLDLCDGVDNDCDTLIDEDHRVTPTRCGVGACSGNTGELRCVAGAVVDTCDPFGGARSEPVVVQAGSPMTFQANTTPAGMAWTAEGFGALPDGGTYGVGYETMPPGAGALINQAVPAHTASVFTRASFNVPSAAAVTRVTLGADYDDGFVAWINGVEVFGSPEMPPGPLTGTTNASPHESSNGLVPDYRPLRDITLRARPLLHDGDNVLAIGVWNRATPEESTDLLLVPRLSIGESDPCNGLDDDCDGLVDEGYPDNDRDGIADCVDPDDDNDGLSDVFDCRPFDPTMSAGPPAEVQRVLWSQLFRPSRLLGWVDQGFGIRYDVAGGRASQLIPDGGVSRAECLGNDLGVTSFDDLRPGPPLGDAFYYLVRAQKDGCGTGSYGLATSGAERRPAAATDCP